MKSKTGYIIGGIIILVVVTFVVLRLPKKQVQTQKQAPTTQTPPVIVTQNNDNSANTATEDPEDIVAGLYKNQIQNTAMQEGFTIIDSKVENNVDQAGKATDDHLELTLKNTAGKDLADFEVYYLITDTTTGQKEGYYKKLADLVLKSGETQAIHFDNGSGIGHFKANKNSLYYNSPNKLSFDVTVSSAGYKIQTAQISKDTGGAEQND